MSVHVCTCLISSTLAICCLLKDVLTARRGKQKSIPLIAGMDVWNFWILLAGSSKPSEASPTGLCRLDEGLKKPLIPDLMKVYGWNYLTVLTYT